jgi:predicted naringenin-chalcone synthase
MKRRSLHQEANKMNDLERRPAILAEGSAMPVYKATQSEVGEWMAASLANRPAQARIIRTLCAYSGIETRYACTAEYLRPPTESRFGLGVTAEQSPSTAERMAIYEQEAPKLGVEAASRALANYAEQLEMATTAVVEHVTHLVVASCTGFFAPGLDFVLAKELGLPATVERTLIGFMGCAAMFNCLRTANYIVQADPSALVLVVSVELSSLHSQPDPTIDHLIGASVFADGASACLVGTPVGKAGGAAGNYFVLDGFHTSMKPDTETEMAWQIGNHGFTLRLSPRVPEHLAAAAPDALASLYGDRRPEFWAIHPGGSAIIDRLAKIFQCTDEEVAASRAVLRDHGNISSATILLVLAEVRRQLVAAAQQAAMGLRPAGGAEPVHGVAMAFGPGLVMEMARLIYVPPQEQTIPAHIPADALQGAGA